MMSMNVAPRHWSPSQGYATGEALIGLLAEGWKVDDAALAKEVSRAPMYTVTVRRDGEEMTVLVLDGPAVRNLITL